eukprot:90191_1
MTSSNWIVSTPLSAERISAELNQLLKINDFEFGKHDSLSKCIQKYNTIDNKWTKWIKLNDFNVQISTSISFACNESKLYGYTNKTLMEINTKQNTHKIYNCNNYTYYPATIIINNKLHVVGGIDNKHSIWNEQQSQFNFKDFEPSLMISHRLIFLESKNILLCMGGGDGFV